MVCSATMRSADEIFCSLHVHLSVAAGISKKRGRRVALACPCSRGRGSLPSLITIHSAYLCEGAH